MTTSPGEPQRRHRAVVGAYGRQLTGATRSEQGNRDLAFVMAVVAGALNAVGFIAVAIYTSHMTGMTALVSDHVAAGEWRLIIPPGTALVSFVAGAASTAILFNWMRRRETSGRFAIVLVLEALLILLFGLLANSLDAAGAELLIIAILGYVMGLQNALITKVSGARIRTTHVTGMVTDIGIELGKAAYRNRRSGTPPVVHDGEKLGLLVAMVSLFAAGGVVGALGYSWIGYPTVIPFALVLLAAGFLPVVDDVRSAQRARRERGTTAV
ncbi:YoaK family protein [Ornithinimicrobium cavernae]|uniref:YoaK family protein n=1 Tax=Ornithinimicrobium cavernae TaxID=2666047 RepID=UPI00192A272C|nr:YoaK family protein [Ornithinimicrobium cavernae]